MDRKPKRTRRPKDARGRGAEPPSVEPSADGFQRLLACIAEPSRYRVLIALAEGDRCVTEVAAAVGLSQSCTTRHLQTLQRAGVLERIRDGKRVLFRIDTRVPDRARVIEWVMLRGATPAGQAENGPVPRAGLGGPQRTNLRTTVVSRLPIGLRRTGARLAEPWANPSEPRIAVDQPVSPVPPVSAGAGEHATLPGSAEPSPPAEDGPPESRPENRPEDQLEDYLL